MKDKFVCLSRSAAEMFMSHSIGRRPYSAPQKTMLRNHFVAVSQGNSNKSYIALGLNAQEFCTIYLTFLDFTEDLRIHHVQHVFTIVVYLPVPTDITSEESHSAMSKELLFQRVKVSRLLQPEHLHLCIDDILQPGTNTSLIGINAQSSDQKCLRMHIVLRCYVWGNS